MTAATAIRESRSEERTITLYPTSHTEADALCRELGRRGWLVRESSGAGYSGPEAKGFRSFVGDEWSVDVINADAPGGDDQ